MPWRLTVRASARVNKARFDTLETALEELEREGRVLITTVPQRAVDTKVRRFEPAQLVAARLELAGPERLLASVNGGLDIRGDGSIEAFAGRVRRRVIEPRRGEDAFAALRREVTEAAG